MSNEELQKKIEELMQKFDLLKQAYDLDHNKLMSNEIDKIFVDIGYAKTTTVTDYGADLTRTVNISSTPTSFPLPENPLKSAIIKASDGVYYRILLYSLT